MSEFVRTNGCAWRQPEEGRAGGSYRFVRSRLRITSPPPTAQERPRQAANREVMVPEPILETERLLLRPFTDDDLDAFAAVCGDPEVMRHYPAPWDREAAA